MKVKKNILFVIFIVIIVGLLFFFFFVDTEVSPSGSTLNEEQLVKDLNRVKGDDIKVLSMNFAIYEKIPDDKKPLYKSKVDPLSRIVNISITNKWSSESLFPYEIEHAMRVWLYIMDRRPPYPIVEIRPHFNVRGIVDQNRIVNVSIFEFEELYDKVINKYPELSEEEMVEKLTELWLENNPDYPRWWVKD